MTSRRSTSPARTEIPRSTAGLSLGYRLFWRLQYTVVAWGGPAQQVLDNDPREQLRRERAQRVSAAERARTTA